MSVSMPKAMDTDTNRVIVDDKMRVEIKKLKTILSGSAINLVFITYFIC